jgi:hypothetical protein
MGKAAARERLECARETVQVVIGRVTIPTSAAINGLRERERMDTSVIVDFIVTYKWWLAVAAPVVLALIVVKILQ